MNTLDLTKPSQLMMALTPELVLMGGAMLILLWAGWKRESDEHQRDVGWASLVLVATTAVAVFWSSRQFAPSTNGPIAIDNFRWMMDVVILLGTGLTIALAMDENRRERILSPESHVLVLFASSGMMLLAAATDLMIVFLGIELMSISVYALAGINRRSARGAEGALKYFLLGAFATAFLLYGIALVYGATGSTNIQRIVGGSTHLLSILVGKFLGVRQEPIHYRVENGTRHFQIPGIVDGAVTPVRGKEGGEQVVIRNSEYWIAPDVIVEPRRQEPHARLRPQLELRRPQRRDLPPRLGQLSVAGATPPILPEHPVHGRALVFLVPCSPRSGAALRAARAVWPRSQDAGPHMFRWLAVAARRRRR